MSSSQPPQTEFVDQPTKLDVEDVAAHFPHTRKLLEERSPSKADASHHSDSSSPHRGGSSAPNSPDKPAVTEHQQEDTDREVDDDDEAAGTLVEGQDEETAKRFIKLHKRRAELSRTVQDRLDRASARRIQIQEERRSHLMQAERQRQAKTQQTNALRKAATEKFVLEAPKHLNILRSAGLVCDETYRPLSADAVELILVSDPRTCEVCTNEADLRRPVCPTTNQPHRRLLVVAAEKFLKLIGDTRVNLIPSKLDTLGIPAPSAAPSSAKKPAGTAGTASAPATTAPPATANANKAKRGITVNPQLFVLAYYNAVLPDGDVDPLLRDCAISMAQTTEQIRRLLVEINRALLEKKLKAEEEDATLHLSADQERMLKPLLVTFSKEWQRYMRLSNQHILSNISAAGKEEARKELVKSTEDALRQNYHRLAAAVAAAAIAAPGQNTNNEATPAASEVQLLSSFVAMMRSRLARVGGEGALRAFDEEMKAAEERQAQQQHLLGASGSSAPKRSPNDETDGYGTSPAVSPEVRPSVAPLLGGRRHNHGLPSLSLPTADHSASAAASNFQSTSELVLASPLLGPPVPPNSPEAIPFSRVPSTANFEDSNAPPSRQNTGAPITASSSQQQTSRIQHQRSNANTLSNDYLGTSGSDTDLGGALPRRAFRPVYGPPLPPLWTVDAQGRSQPPSDDVVQHERRSKLEYRTKAAYTARLKRDAMATTAEAEERLQRENISKAFDEVMWEQFRRELDVSRPPVLGRIPHLLNAVSESLIDALPRRIRTRVGQEIRDVLDWDVLKNRLRSSGSASPTAPPQRFESITGLVLYVINRVGQLGAPAREEELHAQAQALVTRLGVLTGATAPSTSTPSSSDTIGSVVVEMFKFMFEAIRQLRQDIATYSLQMVSQELANKATEYEKEFASECLPSVSEWSSTKAFLAKGATDASSVPMIPNAQAAPSSASAPMQTILQSLPQSVLFITNEDKALFAAVLAGTVDLLRSSGKDTSTRWQLFPKEAFYFARPLVFEAANTIQLSTLRLMLSGTVSMILAPRKIQGAVLQIFLQHLDGKVVQWLEGTSGKQQPQQTGVSADNDNVDDAPVNTIEDLKKAITEEISIFLGSNPQLASPIPSAKPVAQPVDTLLPEADVAVLHGVIAKMADTGSPQYTLFETRILRAVASVAISLIALGGSGLTTSAPATQATSSVGAASISSTAAAAEAALRGCGTVVMAQVREVGAIVASIVLQNWEVHRAHYVQIGLNQTE